MDLTRYMIRFWRAIAICLLFILINSCGESSNDPRETNPATDDTVNNPTNNQTPGAVEDTGEAKTTQNIPVADEIDPRSFVPSGNWLTGTGVKEIDLSSGKIISNDDGRDHDFPACAHPIPAPGLLPAEGIVIDGSLSDWSAKSIVGIDKPEDSDGLAHLDLRSFSWAANDQSYHIAIELSSEWLIENEDPAYLNVFFNSFSLPTDGSSVPVASFSYGFAIIANSLYLLEDEQFVPLTKGTEATQFDYDLEVSGNFIELRINKKDLSTLNGQPFAVDIFTSNAVKQVDRIGPHIVGLVDDYACLVQTPDSNGQLSSYKMLVMRRSPGVDQSIAELSYRAAINALPYAVHLSKSPINDWDTNNVISIDNMNTAGLYIPAIGHFIVDQPNN